MAGEPVVVGLLYRADWTRLSLAGETNDGSSVLLAPGRRYRYESEGWVTGCDGTRPWEMPGDDEDADGEGHWISGPEPPLPELLCPAWLLVGSRLQVRGRARVCGRDAWQVVVTGRPANRSTVTTVVSGRVEAAVDAELGIVLRLVHDADTPEPQVTGFTRLDVDPVIDPARFAVPPGSTRAESWGEMLGGGGPAWQLAKGLAGVAAGGLGAWIRYSSSRRPPLADDDGQDAEAPMPPSDPAPQVTADGAPAGPPVSDELLGRLAEGGAGHFTAAMHQWIDAAAMASQIPDGARRTGFGGLGVLADAISAQPAATHLLSSFHIGGPGQYRVEHSYSPRHGPTTIICDGQQCWMIRDHAATVSPAEPPSRDIAELADPSWLLACRLSGGEPVTAGGRPGYRLSITRGPEGWASLMFPAAVAILDAELGILLRLTYYIGGKPVRRCELRDITGTGEDFNADLPPGLTITEETSPFSSFRDGRPPPPPNLPVAIATALGRQAAAEAGKAARNLLNYLQKRPPEDGT